MEEIGSCSKFILFGLGGSKFVFRASRNHLLPPEPQGGHPVGLYTVFTVNKDNMEQEKEWNKGGRPRKEMAERLGYRIGVKLTAADYFRLLTQAHDTGVSPSEYMRECFRNGHVKERLSKEHSDRVRQLCGMANNLNQLARKANAGGYSEVGWDCKVAGARIHELINRIGV